MNEIVTAIKRVTDIMGEISSASAEQSAGVAQVGGRSRRWTRRRSRTPPLSSRARPPPSLRAQAQQLVAAVAVFKLSLARDDARGLRRRRGRRERTARRRADAGGARIDSQATPTTIPGSTGAARTGRATSPPAGGRAAGRDTGATQRHRHRRRLDGVLTALTAHGRNATGFSAAYRPRSARRPASGRRAPRKGRREACRAWPGTPCPGAACPPTARPSAMGSMRGRGAFSGSLRSASRSCSITRFMSGSGCRRSANAHARS